MRIVFSSEQAARAAVELWEQHGFDATLVGTTVLTDCPTLWAVPILDRSIGLDQVQRVVVHDQRSAVTHGKADQAAEAHGPGRRHGDSPQAPD